MGAMNSGGYWAVRAVSVSLALALVAAAVGCASVELDKKIPWFGHKDDEPTVPAKVVVVWKDAVLNQPGAAPTRGFGGRLMFYGGKTEDPVCVDGQSGLAGEATVASTRRHPCAAG